ncbi:winged helix DNA-binding domain-containing protein [Kitasatospora sp. NA04385]|uniref:winged helix DNA-binding domain-containing protein n=1 Tax=Kitasatospora sp. NA04385 TaxID=2742135 RepID=UPI00158FDB98|nr:winged helix DNA-binding domain-containing protein [Kitasatospora sp. NA04385]QKW19177.1 winged helix DNA-binding domain-containing protein [Kitasatospora sp. NA04385]
MPAVRTLSDRELTVSYFGRQLLHRAERPTAAAAVARLTALQAQYSPSPHLALWARLPGFGHRELEAALLDGTVVKSTLMRGTLHLVAGADYGHLAAAWRRRWLTELRGRHRDADLDEAALEASLRAFAAVPRSADELRGHTAEASGGRVRTADLLHYPRALLPLVHVAPSGHWRAHGKPRLVLWDGELPPEPAATARLVRRYLAGYGPASRADVAHFTGLRLAQVDPALAALGEPVRYLAEDGRELLDLPGAPPPSDPGGELPVRFLPKWDAALLSHADRTRMLPAAIHRQVYRAVNGTLLASYLVDGLVAGVWEHGRAGGAAVLTLTPLLPHGGRAELEREGERLLAFLEPDADRRTVVFAS